MIGGGDSAMEEVTKYTRGIWREPIAPGKYNLNAVAFTAYQVPTSAVTIDWASEGRIGTEVKGVKPTGGQGCRQSCTAFDPLKVTSKDGFQLEVNVRMVIRIQPGNAAYIIARFGSVANLIDQIVHPLIDSSFRNKPAKRKRLIFSRAGRICRPKRWHMPKTDFPSIMWRLKTCS